MIGIFITLAVEGASVWGMVKLTTLLTSITAFIAVLALPATAASPVTPALWLLDFTGEVAEASTEAVLSALTEWAPVEVAVMLEEAAVTADH
jgi:hypothetical protein